MVRPMALRERVTFRLLKVGSCRHLECMAIRGGNWRGVEFPALCALIGHPSQGWILYDTGYSEHFFTATQPFPERFYRAVTPAQLPAAECLQEQLKKLNIETSDIRQILISHFHGDHIAGIRHFARSHFVAMRTDWVQVRNWPRWRGVLNGFLPALLPDNFESRLRFAEDCLSVDLPAWLRPLTVGYDLLGDTSLIAVPLPGHSRAQMGLLLKDQTDQIRFLVADACWSMPACRAGLLPSRLASTIFSDNEQYERTFFGLRQIALREPDVSLLPSHCLHSWLALEQHHV
jgi:glyoxylase-like metal-dependent hydrolase (beta-lactamase superfamily II)